MLKQIDNVIDGDIHRTGYQPERQGIIVALGIVGGIGGPADRCIFRIQTLDKQRTIGHCVEIRNGTSERKLAILFDISVQLLHRDDIVVDINRASKRFDEAFCFGETE